MRKLLLIILASLFMTGTSYAANVDVRVEQPKSPTNQNSFPLNFVVLDTLGRPVSVKCFKKGPSDGGFVQFGSTINLAPGGNSGNCNVDSSVLSANGTYEFKIEVTAGGDTDAETTSVNYNTSGPGDPRDYQKNKTNSCEYTIHFKTADDSGKTVKVEVYRSENISFNTDSGTRVGTVFAGSDEIKDFPNTIPDCNKTYYYAVRAFDSSSNGSGVVGDSVTTTTVTYPTTTTQQTTAVPVSSGSVLGKTIEPTPTETPSPESSGEVEGASSETIESETDFPIGWMVFGGILGMGILLYAIAKFRQSR